MATKFIKENALRQFAKSKGRRVSYDFFQLFDRFVEQKMEKACTTKNGSKVTLDVEVAKYVGL
jgi:hypothetical protein